MRELFWNYHPAQLALKLEILVCLGDIRALPGDTRAGFGDRGYRVNHVEAFDRSLRNRLNASVQTTSFCAVKFPFYAAR